jgi:multiple sugar transport system ATP-binding protein
LASVELKDITKVYDKDVVAVDAANIHIKDKEFVVLVGPSGCGKSTILRMIAGLEEITRGELFIDNKRVNDVPPKDRDIAMVFQNYALYPHMTVYQNMAFGLKLRKFPKEEIKKRVTEAAEILGIEILLNRKPKALSGGQRQRVAVGRAIVRKPKVFLFDEPLSNLDAKLRVQMRTEISKLHTRLGATMVYVTHDQVEAMTMGDRIIVIQNGKIQQTDTPLNVYNNPRNKFVAGFIGSPAMNFIPGQIVLREAPHFVNGSLDLRIAEIHQTRIEEYVGRDIILGIRPEDIYESSRIKEVRNPSVVSVHTEVIEPMGNETFLYASAGPHSLVARIFPNTNIKINTDCQIGFDMGKVHYFDMQTEEAIL